MIKFSFWKILKYLGFIILVLLIVLIVLFYNFSTPKSDSEIKKGFKKSKSEIFIKKQQFEDFEYRVLKSFKKPDTSKFTVVFIHGSIGAAYDFKRYLTNNKLRSKANLIAYDRVGYGIKNTGEVQESINFEVSLLHNVLSGFNTNKVVLVGYSYGGPIALASFKKYKKIVVLAPAVSAKDEPIPWAINLYKWKATRWLLPKTWKAASKEKLSHKTNLKQFEPLWQNNTTAIVSIHGTDDWIVPVENSYFLKTKLPPKQFELVLLKGAGHGLLWTRFDTIKNVLVKQLN